MTTLKHPSLLHDELISDVLLADAPWAESHGADPQNGYLGAGLLYYTLAYMLRAKLCVCIGSGGGFVPRLMRQAQRDLGLDDARTILIDGDTGGWSRPQWLKEDSFFRKAYPEIEILLATSRDVSERPETRAWQIDYLHIDGDHSHSGSLEDFQRFEPLMSPRGLISFHDTKPYEYYNVTCWKTLADLRAEGYQVVDLPWIGCGTAVIAPGRSVRKPNPARMLKRRYLQNFISTILRRIKAGLSAPK